MRGSAQNKQEKEQSKQEKLAVAQIRVWIRLDSKMKCDDVGNKSAGEKDANDVPICARLHFYLLEGNIFGELVNLQAIERAGRHSIFVKIQILTKITCTQHDV